MTTGKILLVFVVAILIMSLTPFSASCRKPDDPTCKPVVAGGVVGGR